MKHILLVFFFLFSLCSFSVLTQATETSAYCATSSDREILLKINTYREQNGIHSLIMSQTLGGAAEHHSYDMPNQGQNPSHTLSDGTTWVQNIANHGYPMDGTTRGENIGWGFGGNSDSMMTWWKSSDGHNRNLLDARWTAIGVAERFTDKSYWGWYWTLNFGTQFDVPASVCNVTSTPTTSIETPTPKQCKREAFRIKHPEICN